MQSMIPPSVAFRRARESTWRELEQLVARAENSSLRRLGSRDVARLPLLYRSTVASLAASRNMCLDRNVVDYLENLTARAHVAMTTSKPNIKGAIRAFFGEQFPVQVRALSGHLLAATLLLCAGAAVAFVLTLDDPERFYNFVPEAYSQGRGPEASSADLQQILYDEGTAADQLASFSSFLLSNNARIGMLCFALGFAFGVPVLYLLFTNGMIIGAFGALYHQRGMSGEFWAWMLPHGVTEILAVLLCGAAGLAMAQAIIFPGRSTRMTNLARVGKQAGTVVLGAVFMFFLAALIEGFFRQLVHDVVIRYTVVFATATLWLAYFTLGGRARRAAKGAQ